jgi:Pyruvate/2-oxoacid:ferredoxin oxidoreductase delta subunit
MDLHGRGLHEDAMAAILEENPLPGLCGRICFAPCERVCNRGQFDEAVSIRELERFAAEGSLTKAQSAGGPERGRPAHVAVLGGGPEGISCAWFLARLGHRVSLFEPGERPAIYRDLAGLTPEPLLEREVRRITTLCVETVTGFSTGPNSLEKVFEGFDAVYISGPLSGPVGFLQLPEDPGPVFTMAALRRAAASDTPSLSGTVAIAGGGTGFFEAARAVLDRGGRPVVLLGRSRKDDEALPGDPEDIPSGAEVRFETGFRGLSFEGNRIRVLVGKAGESSSEGDLEADALIYVPGLKGARPHLIPRMLPSGLTVILDPEDPPQVRASEAERSRQAVRGLARGKQAALSLDLSLGNRALDTLASSAVGRLGALSAGSYAYPSAAGNERRPDGVVRTEDLNTACFRKSPRIQPTEGGLLTPDQAAGSAGRCFNCGFCTFCGACDDYCPDLSIRIDRTERQREIDYEHCKGCGICARECPRGAIIVIKESEAG